MMRQLTEEELDSLLKRDGVDQQAARYFLTAYHPSYEEARLGLIHETARQDWQPAMTAALRHGLRIMRDVPLPADTCIACKRRRYISKSMKLCSDCVSRQNHSV